MTDTLAPSAEKRALAFERATELVTLYADRPSVADVTSVADWLLAGETVAEQMFSPTTIAPPAPELDHLVLVHTDDIGALGKEHVDYLLSRDFGLYDYNTKLGRPNRETGWRVATLNPADFHEPEAVYAFSAADYEALPVGTRVSMRPVRDGVFLIKGEDGRWRTEATPTPHPSRMVALSGYGKDGIWRRILNPEILGEFKPSQVELKKGDRVVLTEDRAGDMKAGRLGTVREVRKPGGGIESWVHVDWDEPHELDGPSPSMLAKLVTS